MVRGEIWEYFNSSGIESEAALQDVQMVLGKHLSRTTARQCPWWVRSTASCQKQQISRMWIHREISHHHHWLKMRPHLDQTEEWHTLSGCREFNGTNIEGSPSGNEKMQSTHEGAAVEVDFKCKWKGDEWSVRYTIHSQDELRPMGSSRLCLDSLRGVTLMNCHNQRMHQEWQIAVCLFGRRWELRWSLLESWQIL